MSLSIISSTLFYTDVQIINLMSASATFIVGCLIYIHDRKNRQNIIALILAFLLAFWAFASTMTDIIRTPDGAMFWARTAFLGPLFFAGVLVIFSYEFPTNKTRLSYKKMALIMLPSLLALPFIYTNYNVSAISFEEWGTDYTPGILYNFGLPYALGYMIFALIKFLKTLKATTDRLQKDRIILVVEALVTVLATSLTVNGIFPLLFDYTKAGPYSAGASLVFVILMCYAMYAKGALVPKAIATEFFSFVLCFIVLAHTLASDSPTALIRNAIVLAWVIGFTYLLVGSVHREVRRREEVQALAKQLELANSSLESANAHLKELDQRKDEFISIVSHQLRTPVAVMKGYISLMQEGVYGQMPEKMADKVDNMMLMNERLVQMIDNMLNVTRIEQNRIEYSCALVDVRPVLDQVVEQLQPKAAAKGMNISLGEIPYGPLVAYVDFEKLIEVLTNLVDNSIKYSAGGSVIIDAMTAPRKKSVIIKVTDHGLGMDLETSQNVFHKFFRSNNPAVMVQGGTGLGLYVCAMFVRGMGGDIWIEHTAPNEGTSIAFALPMEPGGHCTAPHHKITPPAIPPGAQRKYPESV